MGDGRLDLIGCGDDGVYVSFNSALGPVVYVADDGKGGFGPIRTLTKPSRTAMVNGLKLCGARQRVIFFFTFSVNRRYTRVMTMYQNRIISL